MSAIRFAEDTSNAVDLDLIGKPGFDAWLDMLSARDRAWAVATGFDGAAGKVCVFPDEAGGVSRAAAGMGSEKDARRKRFLVAQARTALPAGIYRLARHDLDGEALAEAALGWLFAGYRFARYKTAEPPGASLLPPDGIDADRIEAIAAAETLTRDLINTPAADMGPAELARAATDLAEEFGAHADVIAGSELIDRNFPMIHAVGRAAAREPRLVDFSWGDGGPKVTLVGKGVCFDTGGLNLKPGNSMALMKKDMGGAATVLGLARMIMATRMPVQLRVLIPAVENSVAGSSFRPGDILTSRSGKTVEINNTDAEGRLVLADALTYACEADPDLVVSMATLTGAARVAVGPDLAPYFTDDNGVAAELATAADKVRDPVWRMPFWDPYEPMIEPGIADLDNAPSGGMAGSITAALFLRRFAAKAPRYVHFDIYGWQPSAAPGRPKGGVGQGARALFEALPGLVTG